MKCNKDCFNCTYKDCINDSFTSEELSKDSMPEELTEEQLHARRLSRERNKRYSESHREELRKKSLDNYHANREEYNARARQWCRNHKEEVAKRKKEYYHRDLEESRRKQREYRARVKSALPVCDRCSDCMLVKRELGDGYRRLCLHEMQLIETRVAYSPKWCYRREINE